MTIEMNFIAGMMLGVEFIELDTDEDGVIKAVVVDLFFLRFMCFYD